MQKTADRRQRRERPGKNGRCAGDDGTPKRKPQEYFACRSSSSGGQTRAKPGRALGKAGPLVLCLKPFADWEGHRKGRNEQMCTEDSVIAERAEQKRQYGRVLWNHSSNEAATRQQRTARGRQSKQVTGYASLAVRPCPFLFLRCSVFSLFFLALLLVIPYLENVQRVGGHCVSGRRPRKPEVAECSEQTRRRGPGNRPVSIRRGRAVSDKSSSEAGRWTDR